MFNLRKSVASFASTGLSAANQQESIIKGSKGGSHILRGGMVAAMASLVTLTAIGSASAQTYRGDAYGANIGIGANLVVAGVRVGATIVDNDNLPGTGSGTALTNQLLNANVQAETGNPLSSLLGVLTANTINTSTIGTGGVATSVSQIEGISLFPNLGINVLGLGALNLGSLVQADVIRSTTTANASGNSGRTEIANLRFGVVSLGDFDVDSAVSSTYYLNLNGTVNANASANVLLPDIAQLVINGQSLSDGGSTRTTEALAVRVLQGNPIAEGRVVVASSTAGFVGAAVVPEAGTVALFGAGILPIALGIIARRRKA